MEQFTCYNIIDDSGQWHEFLPHMIATYLVDNESDMLADVIVAYRGRDIREPDVLTTIHVSGSRGKLLAKAIRGERICTVGSGGVDGLLPTGYGMYQVTKENLGAEETYSAFRNLLNPDFSHNDAARIVSYIQQICLLTNCRISFEWVENAHGNPDHKHIWSGITPLPITDHNAQKGESKA